MGLTCKICTNKQNNITYKVKEMMFGTRDEFTYFECHDCGCLQINEFPTNLNKYYPNNYYSFNLSETSDFNGLSGAFRKFQYLNSLFGSKFYQNTIGRFIDKKFYYLLKKLNLNKNSRILDVGCGDGKNFLFPLAELGFSKLHGCDPFLENHIKYSNGLNIQKGNIDEIDGEWDLITYHHSYEHVPDPLYHLKQIESLLAEGGTCMLRIPTTSSFAWKHYREFWSQLDAPRHLFLHSQKSITLLAEQAGLKLTSIVYDSGHFQFSGSELYKQDIPLNAPRKKGLLNAIKRKLKKQSYIKRSIKLNKANNGDQAAFYLKKQITNPH